MIRPGMRKTRSSRRRLKMRLTSIAKAGDLPDRHAKERVDDADRLLLLLFRHVQYLRQARHNSRNVKERAKRRCVATSHQQRRKQMVLHKAGRKSSIGFGRFKVPAAFFSLQIGDSGRKGRTTMTGIAGSIPNSSA